MIAFVSFMILQESPIDTIRNDSAQSKPLFDDLVKYNADDSVRFSIQEKKVYLYGNGFVKYLRQS